MRILSISSEALPYAKTGGLADAMGALARTLHERGHDIRLFTPLYDRVDQTGLRLRTELSSLVVSLGAHRYRIRVVRDEDRPWAWLLDCPELWHRGSVYTQQPDEHRRFLALGVAALATCQRMGFAPEIVQCNDWQAAMVPLLMRVRFGWDRLFSDAKTLLTIHNLGYQGGYPATILPDLEIGGNEHLLHQEYLRRGRINFLLHGILYADWINTVSPTYAREIQTPAQGVGLDPYLRARTRTVSGILNGIDDREWNPAADPLVAHPYSADDLSGKARNKAVAQARFGLPVREEVPLFAVVSRMVWQKGLELVERGMPEFLATDRAQLIVLGRGEPRVEEMFRRLQARFPRSMAFESGFTNGLAHVVEAGADLFLMPSRYEPCGLNQMYSLRYGTIPIVHRTGGLADTVTPFHGATRTGNGVVFLRHDVMTFRRAVLAGLALYHDPVVWPIVRRNAMQENFSWDRQAARYEELFVRMRS